MEFRIVEAPNGMIVSSKSHSVFMPEQDYRDRMLVAIVKALLVTHNQPSSSRDLQRIIDSYSLLDKRSCCSAAVVSQRINQHFKRNCQSGVPLLGKKQSKQSVCYFIDQPGIPVEEFPRSNVMDSLPISDFPTPAVTPDRYDSPSPKRLKKHSKRQSKKSKSDSVFEFIVFAEASSDSDSQSDSIKLSQAGILQLLPTSLTLYPPLPVNTNLAGVYMAYIADAFHYVAWYCPHKASLVDADNVNCNSVVLLRRADSDLVNASTLLHAGGVATDQEQAIVLSLEQTQITMSSDQSEDSVDPLKGVWIPLERARVVAKTCGLSKKISCFLNDSLSITSFSFSKPFDGSLDAVDSKPGQSSTASSIISSIVSAFKFSGFPISKPASPPIKTPPLQQHSQPVCEARQKPTDSNGLTQEQLDHLAFILASPLNKNKPHRNGSDDGSDMISVSSFTVSDSGCEDSTSPELEPTCVESWDGADWVDDVDCGGHDGVELQQVFPTGVIPTLIAQLQSHTVPQTESDSDTAIKNMTIDAQPSMPLSDDDFNYNFVANLVVVGNDSDEPLSSDTESDEDSFKSKASPTGVCGDALSNDSLRELLYNQTAVTLARRHFNGRLMTDSVGLEEAQQCNQMDDGVVDGHNSVEEKHDPLENDEAYVSGIVTRRSTRRSSDISAYELSNISTKWSIIDDAIDPLVSGRPRRKSRAADTPERRYSTPKRKRGRAIRSAGRGRMSVAEVQREDNLSEHESDVEIDILG